MRTKSKKALSMLLTLCMVFGLFAAFPMTASAANGEAVIDVSQLNSYNANNKGNKSESQWEYSIQRRKLELKTKDGHYRLTGTNADLNITTKENADGMFIVLDNVNITRTSVLQGDGCVLRFAAQDQYLTANNNKNNTTDEKSFFVKKSFRCPFKNWNMRNLIRFRNRL